MKSFSVSIAIEAPAEIIWHLLTGAAAYPDWNSTVEKIEGRITPGGKITVHTTVAGRSYKLRISSFEPNRGMVWSGGLPPGLYSETRRFTLTPGDDGTVTFEMHERYRGLLAPLMTRFIPNLQPAFNMFATDLKWRAEQMR
jgi:hypothetical protein